ncbi:MAG: stage II sporulation protein R [Lachnospiraceae bacterium]|nr:stage II sporulation protein R [Lachnospiraceae bacterium]
MKKYTIALSILCTGILLCLVTSRFTVKEVSTPLAEQVLRLHVLANSDSDEDQALKLNVKSAIVDALSPVLSDTTEKAAACQWVSANLDELQTIAAQVIADEGYDYPVTVACETVWFPNKTYGDMTFPCGYYDALRVCIGEAVGANWWCVLYPPLCFVDLTCGVVPDESKDKLQTVLDEDNYNNLFAEDGQVVVRFRILEWLGELFG